MSSQVVAQAKPYLPENSLEFFTVQVLAGERRYVSLYGNDRCVPYCIREQISLEDCKGLLDNAKGPVTFTVRVPLMEFTHGHANVVTYIQDSAFDFEVTLEGCEFRPVGAILDGVTGDAIGGELLVQVIATAIRPC